MQSSIVQRICIMLLLLALLFVLLRDILFRNDAVLQLMALHHLIEQDHHDIAAMNRKNHDLEQIVWHLHRHDEILEREARYVGGLVKSNETFYQLTPRKSGRKT